MNSLEAKSSMYLVLDVGTTGIKALIFDEALNLIGRVNKDMTKKRLAGGRVEQDPIKIIVLVKEAIAEIINNLKIDSSRIKSVGITNQRETIVAWNSETGEPIHPAVVWEDSRTAAYCFWLRLAGKNKGVRERTGLPIIPYFSASKIRWILKNTPQAKELLDKGILRIGTIDTWLLWNLSEEKTFATDYTNASRTLLFNILTLSWDNYLLKLFDLSGLINTALAQIKPPKANFGRLRGDILASRPPIMTLCGDQQASTYAALPSEALAKEGGIYKTTKITFGTGAFLVQILGEKFSLCPPFFTTLIPGSDPTGKPLYAIEQKVGECASRVTPAIGDQKALDKVFTDLAHEMNPYIKKLPTKPIELILDGGAIRNGALARIEQEVSGVKTREQIIFDGTALGVARILGS